MNAIFGNQYLNIFNNVKNKCINETNIIKDVEKDFSNKIFKQYLDDATKQLMDKSNHSQQGLNECNTSVYEIQYKKDNPFTKISNAIKEDENF